MKSTNIYLEKGKKADYEIKSDKNGVYVFVLDGDVTVEGQTLNKRDGFGVWDTNNINIEADNNSKVLLMEVPMSL